MQNPQPAPRSAPPVPVGLLIPPPSSVAGAPIAAPTTTHAGAPVAAGKGAIAATFLGVCGVAALALLLSHGWQRLGIGQNNIGPRGIEYCPELYSSSSCIDHWWSSVPLSGPVPIFAVLTLITGAVAIGFSFASSGLVFARRRALVPHRTGRIVIACALPVAAAWQVLVSTSKDVAGLDSLDMTGMGPAGAVYLLVLAIAWVCLHRLAKHARS